MNVEQAKDIVTTLHYIYGALCLIAVFTVCPVLVKALGRKS